MDLKNEHKPELQGDGVLKKEVNDIFQRVIADITVRGNRNSHFLQNNFGKEAIVVS